MVLVARWWAAGGEGWDARSAPGCWLMRLMPWVLFWLGVWLFGMAGIIASVSRVSAGQFVAGWALGPGWWMNLRV